MAQTSYLGLMVAPSGHRLVVQAGTHAFTTTGKAITLQTRGLRKIVSAVVHPNQATAGVKTNQIACYIPYVASGDIGVENPDQKLIVSRLTGGVISGLTFSYNFVGY